MIRFFTLAIFAVGLIFAQQSDDELARALQLAQQEKYAEAAGILQTLLTRNPANAEARYNLALALLALGKPQDALHTIEGWRGDPDAVPFRYLRGKLEASAGKDQAAEKDLIFAAKAQPQEEAYGLDLGMFYIRHQNFVGAIAILKQAAQYHPDSNYILLALALAQSFAGKTAYSIETARRILKSNPGFSEARLVLAHALYMDGDYSGCEKQSSAAIQAGDSNPYLSYLRAASRFKLNSTDWNAILADLDSSQKSIPDCEICWLLRSKVDQARGDQSSAISDLEHIVSTNAGFAQAWPRLAVLYQRAGRTNDAVRARAMYQKLRMNEQLDAEKRLAQRYLLGSLQ